MIICYLNVAGMNLETLCRYKKQSTHCRHMFWERVLSETSLYCCLTEMHCEKELNQESWCFGRVLNPTLPEYEVEILPFFKGRLFQMLWSYRCHCRTKFDYKKEDSTHTGGAVKSLARPTSRCILFDGKKISFDASLVIYIYIYIYIQGVPGGMWQTSGGCSLC